MVLGLSSPPQLLSEHASQHGTRKALILFGDVCVVCPSGDIVESLVDEELLLIFEETATDGDIQRFMETFHASGLPVTDDGSVREYVEKMASCRKDKRWRYNYFVTLDLSGEIENVERF